MYECIRIISTIKCKKKKKPKEQSLKNGIYSLIFQVLQLSSSVLMMVKRLYDWRNFCQKLLLHASKTSKRTLTSTECCMSYYWAHFIYFPSSMASFESEHVLPDNCYVSSWLWSEKCQLSLYESATLKATLW